MVMLFPHLGSPPSPQSSGFHALPPRFVPLPKALGLPPSPRSLGFHALPPRFVPLPKAFWSHARFLAFRVRPLVCWDSQQRELPHSPSSWQKSDCVFFSSSPRKCFPFGPHFAVASRAGRCIPSREGEKGTSPLAPMRSVRCQLFLSPMVPGNRVRTWNQEAG